MTGVVFPTFEEYPNRKNGQEIISYIPSNPDFSYAATDLENYYSDKDLSALLLINPDNPSGNFISKENVLLLATWAKARNILLIVDESFVDFTEGSTENTLLHNEILESFDNLIVMKSISKSYGVPGLRLGVIATSDTQFISRMKKDVSIWNINSFAEFYMQIFGKYENDYRKACIKFRNERERFFRELQRIPYLRVIPSQANYFLCEVTDKYSSKELSKLLLDKANILIKDCGAKAAFSGRDYVRIAVRGKEDNDSLVDILNRLM